MRKSLVIIYFATAGILLAQTAGAQEILTPEKLNLSDTGLPSLTGPLNDVLDTAKKINTGLDNAPFIKDFADKAQGASSDIKSAIGLFETIKKTWDTANTWCEANIGISLREIVSVAAGAFIWLLEFVLKLVRAALGSVQGM